MPIVKQTLKMTKTETVIKVYNNGATSLSVDILPSELVYTGKETIPVANDVDVGIQKLFWGCKAAGTSITLTRGTTPEGNFYLNNSGQMDFETFLDNSSPTAKKEKITVTISAEGFVILGLRKSKGYVQNETV